MSVEKFMPVKLPPGLQNDGTTYQSKNAWHTGNLIRFFQGNIQPVGGSVARVLTGAAILGIPRAAISWQLPTGVAALAVGTTSNLYVIISNVVTDITPLNLFPGGDSANRIWQLDTLGTYLVAVDLNDEGSVAVGMALGGSPFGAYVWTGDTTKRALEIRSPEGANPVTPIHGVSTVVTPEKFLQILAPSDPLGVLIVPSAVVDPRLVWWCSQGEYLGTKWRPASTNSAGSFQLATEGSLVCGRAGRNQTLIWTTVDLWVQTYIGGTLIYRFDIAGSNCGPNSSRSPVMVDTAAYWMGRNRFFMYDGYVLPLPCSVQDYVFQGPNKIRSGYEKKTWGFANTSYGEVTWYYVGGAGTEVNSYVTYNYVEKHWTYGTSFPRTIGVSFQLPGNVPVLFDVNEVVYDHETGNVPSGPFLESGPLELGDGDNVTHLHSIVPDDITVGDVQMKIYTSFFPDDVETLSAAIALTKRARVRLTARQIRLRIEQAASTAWRIGVIRLGVKAGGTR
jgi:hypothetical protein